MSRFIIRAATALTLLVTAACTQTPAQVDLRGGNTYSRGNENSGGNNSYASNNDNRSTPSFRYYASSSKPASYEPYQPAPVYTNTPRSVSQSTSQTASVSSISASDLAPPSKAEKPVAMNHASINQWTKKPRTISETNETASASASKEVVLTSSRESSDLMWPVNGKKVISNFGPKGAGKANDGINIASAEGEPVWAASDGEVVYAGNELAGYGNMVLIKHAGSKTTTYAHLSRATVDKYDRVKQGDIIGYVGSTGNVKSPQLHFAVHDGKDPVDPQKYLSRSVAGL